MSNITLSIDDDIIKQARLKSVQEGVSLSAKVRELLHRYAMGQLDDIAPDLSFSENALLYSAQNLDSRAAVEAGTPDQMPAPLAPDGAGVDPDYLRKIRGWAREDLYDRPTQYGKK